MTKQENESENFWTADDYEVGLKYCSLFSEEFKFPLRVVERHLTEETDRVIVQAVGLRLLITIPSERDTIRVSVPLQEWSTGKAKHQKFVNGRCVSISRFSDVLPDEYGTINASIEVLGEEYDGIL